MLSLHGPPGSMTHISCITKSVATALGLKHLVSHFASQCQALPPHREHHDWDASGGPGCLSRRQRAGLLPGANPPCMLHSHGDPACSGMCVGRRRQWEGEVSVPRGNATSENYPMMIYCSDFPGSSHLRRGSCKWVNRKEI